MDRVLNDNAILKNTDSVPFIAFKSLEDIPWLGCGFSTRLGGVSKGIFSTMNMSFTRGDDEACVRENIRLFSESAGFDFSHIVMPHQCHTTNVRVVGRNEWGCGVTGPGCMEEIDGQITNEDDTVLYCLGADCVPVFMVDVEKRTIAASHAGWKGTVNNIVKATINRMISEFDCNPQNMKAVIGPSICVDCYEVSEDVASVFIDKYRFLDDVTKVVRPASGSFEENPTGKFYLDLWEANRINLINSGLKSENIEISGYCTKCHPDMLFSHRHHGDERGVNIGYIFRRSES